MNKIVGILLLICLLSALIGCTSPRNSDEGFGAGVFYYSTAEKFEKDIKESKNKVKTSRINKSTQGKDSIRFIPEDYYLVPDKGVISNITLGDNVTAIFTDIYPDAFVIYWNLVEAHEMIYGRINKLGGYNILHTPDRDSAYLFSKISIDNIEYTIERVYPSQYNIDYRNSVGNPLTKEEIGNPYSVRIYWEQDGALIKYGFIQDEDKKEKDDAVLVSRAGKLKKVYFPD